MSKTHMNSRIKTGELYARIAGDTAERWANKTLDDRHADPEAQTIAAVILDLRAEVAQLRERVDISERLARNLGSDMLYALEAELLPNADDGMRPIGYIARGWQRDHDRIDIADCTEGEQVTAALDQLPDDHFDTAKPQQTP